MDIEQFRKAGYATIDSICDYYETMRDRPVKAQVEPGYLIEALPGEIGLDWVSSGFGLGR
jgi:aromatic-L-amino-acid decarboxylase